MEFHSPFLFVFANLLVILGHCEIQNRSIYSKVYAKFKGDIYIGGLFSMNRRGSEGKCNELIEQDGLQVLAAAIYAIREVENMGLLPLKLGLLAIDTCQDPDYVLAQSSEFLQFRMTDVQSKYLCSDGSHPRLKEELKSFRNIFGIFGAGNSDVSKIVSWYLKLINLPQLSFFSTSPELSNNILYPTFFRTIPSDKFMSRAIIQLLKLFKWTYLIIVNDDSAYSTETTKSFMELIQNETQSKICVAQTITIQTQNLNEMNIYVDKIEKEANETQAARVALTFLKQPIAEQFISYIESHPSEMISKMLWIGTDSWGSRNWHHLHNTTSILNNAIAVIPKAFNNSEFAEYYQQRLPASLDHDPWLAYQFETECGCQYKNESLFIFFELIKIRPPSTDARACETEEDNCSKRVYKDFKQMLYIHYVIDGIFAYAHALKGLIPANCAQVSMDSCKEQLFKKGGPLSIGNITSQLRKAEFTDSTGEHFKFWGQDGSPKYSIVYFNKTINAWSIAGQISDTFELKVETSFEVLANETYQFLPCSEPCKPRHVPSNLRKCCWTCTPCDTDEIINASEEIPVCQKCPPYHTADVASNTCVHLGVIYISFSDDVALSLILFNITGLLFSLISCSIMIIYWSTPIIKASGRETSVIILIATMLSFSVSIALLNKPNNLTCYLRWCSVGFCSTLGYAAILTKTNRIARIFGIKLSSKSTTPRFISPLSQVNIVLLITAIECAIVALVLTTSSVETELHQVKPKPVLDCKDIPMSGIVCVFLIPSFLLLSSTIYAYKIRKTPDGFNETRNINFINFCNCIILVTCFLLHQVLKQNQYTVLPFCLLLTLGSHGNLMGLFYPKIYIVLFRPSKNTLQAIRSKTRSKSQQSFSHSPSISSETVSVQNSRLNLANLRCRRCDLPISSSVELDSLTDEVKKDKELKSKSKTKVNFVNMTSTRDVDCPPPRRTEMANFNITFVDDL